MRSWNSRAAVGGVVAMLMVGAVLESGPTASASPTAGSAAIAPAAAAKRATRFTPAPGVTFNNPYGPEASRRAIIRKLLNTIDSVPRRGEIRIASWNVRSNNITQALLRAKHRGVVVRVVMDKSNWTEGVPNRDAATLAAGLAVGNEHRRPERRSWLRRCSGACRGPHGIAHTKFYLFSKAGRAKDVVIYGSNNATELAANIQWNDIYTRVNRPKVYEAFKSVFGEMAKERRPKGGAYRSFDFGKFSATFYPDEGTTAPAGDPVMTVLDAVRCQGATGPGNVNGRTKIRIAQTAMYGQRGITIAKRLAQMHRRGCDIRIVYAMFGNEVLRILRREAGRSPIPMTHLAWDRDDDGIYDRYVHMKSMAIRGVYKGDTNASLTINGSANWTPVALSSEEVVGQIVGAETARRYIDWIDFLFTHRPASWGSDDPGSDAPDGSVERRGRTAAVDPYALIRQDL